MPVNSFENYPMSWKPHISSGTEPLYLSLASQLESDIYSGQLAPNTKLPPQRELADYLDVNLSTITRAFKLCTLKGLLYGIVGKGTFVSANSLLSSPSSDISSSMLNIEPFSQTNHLVIEAAAAILKRPNFSDALSYDNSSSEELHRISASRFLNTFNIKTDPDKILLCPGSQNALSTILLTAFHAGDKIAVDQYTYHHFKMLANHLSIQLLPVQTDSMGMIPDELKKRCSRDNISGIYLMPVCQNPTTVTMPPERKYELVSVIKIFKLTVIEDNPYPFLNKDNSLSFYSLYPEGTFMVNGLSKMLCSGLRIAIVMFPEDFKNNLLTAFISLNLKMSSFDAEIMSELINSGIYMEILTEKLKLLSERCAIANDYIPLTSEYESKLSFYRWISIGDIKPSLFTELCKTKGLLVYPSSYFAVDTEKCSYIRAAISTPKDISLLIQGLNIIKDQIK